MLYCAGCGKELGPDEMVIEVERMFVYCFGLCALSVTVDELVEHVPV